MPPTAAPPYIAATCDGEAHQLVHGVIAARAALMRRTHRRPQQGNWREFGRRVMLGGVFTLDTNRAGWVHAPSPLSNFRCPPGNLHAGANPKAHEIKHAIRPGCCQPELSKHDERHRSPTGCDFRSEAHHLCQAESRQRTSRVRSIRVEHPGWRCAVSYPPGERDHTPERRQPGPRRAVR